MSTPIHSLRRGLPGALEGLLILLLAMLAPFPAMAATHTVAPGETLGGIAARNGVSVTALASANRISDPNVVVAGTLLRLPGTAAPTTTSAGGGNGYTVRPGDTLASVAARYGVSVDALARANGISNPNLIQEGAQLSIPGRTAGGSSGTVVTRPAVMIVSGRSHTIRSGDTLGAIAARYGVSVASVAQANGIADANSITLGARLRIPSHGGSVTTAPVSAAPASAGAYRVAPGDTVASIAARYGTSVSTIVVMNAMANPNHLAAGQVLRVPGMAGGVQTGAYIGTRTVPSGEVIALINSAAARYGVDPALARAIAYQESGFNHNVRSNVGAIGTMQLMPTTAQWVGPMLVGRQIDPYSVRDNVEGGVAYLAWLHRRTGDSRHAAAGYYQGLNALKTRGMFDDTKDYVASVMRHYGRV